MVPIRKRPQLAARASAKQELHESSNGGLHLHAGPTSNPRFQDPRSYLIKQDHLQLAGSGFGVTDQRPPQRQVTAESAALKSKPHIAVLCEVQPKKKNNGMKLGEGNPRAMMGQEQKEEVKQTHMHDGDDDGRCTIGINAVTQEVGLAASGASDTGKRDTAEACKKARHDAPAITEIPCLDRAIHLGVTDYPRKVLPLQLILMSSQSRLTAAKIPAHDKPTQRFRSSGSTVSTPSKRNTLSKPRRDEEAHEEKLMASPTCRDARAYLPSSTAGVSGNDVPEFADVDIQDEIKLRCSQNHSDESSERPISSWQGHRRARSFMQGGRGNWTGSNGESDLFAGGRPGVNVGVPLQLHQNGMVIEDEKQMKMQPVKKEMKQAMARKPILKKKVEKLDNIGSRLSLQTSRSSSAVSFLNGELQQQLESGVTENKTNMKKRNQSLPSTPCTVPILGSIIENPKMGSKNCKSAAHTDDDPETKISAAPANHASTGAHDQLQPDFMRCRRKDGRRWRCKEQVVKPGAPFCQYHTVKMREKHATSVVRKISKQMQEEPEIKETSRSGRRRAKSSPTNKAMQDIRHCAGLQRCNQEEDGDTEEEGEEDDEAEEDVHAKLENAKQQEAASVTTPRRRWRKKCKPCIRRLHDIHDRARPAATDSLDFTNSCGEDLYNDSPAIRLASPLPECVLNTDPYEWRSDFLDYHTF